MCCIIHRPKDAKQIAENRIEAIIKVNPDGWGISYFKNGSLEVYKSMNMDEALKKIRELEEENIEFLFHARWATHGKINLRNCHPYQIHKGVLFHNGKISVRCKSKALSDTYYFTTKVSRLLKKGRSLDAIFDIFKGLIGESRFAVMMEDGTIKKVGKWHKLDDCEYSKLNWQYKVSSGYSYGGYNYGYSSGTSHIDEGEKEWYDWLSPSKRKKFTSVVPGDTPLEELIVACKNGRTLSTYLLKRLDERELIKLARLYPEACAEYFKSVILC